MDEVRTIAAFQVRELLQRRILWLIVGAALCGLAFMGWAVHTVAHEPAPPEFVRTQVMGQMLTFTLILSALLTSLLAVLTAVGSLSGEIESGRIQMVLSRPVSRAGVFFGHATGLAAVVGGYAAWLYLSVLLTFGWASGHMPAGWAGGILVFPLGALIVLALALLLSARAGTLGAGVACLALLLLAWIGSGVETVGYIIHRQGLQVAGVLVSLLLPMAAVNNWVTSHLRGVMTLPLEFNLTPSPSGWMLLWACLYLAAVLAAGALVFRRRDV